MLDEVIKIKSLESITPLIEYIKRIETELLEYQSYSNEDIEKQIIELENELNKLKEEIKRKKKNIVLTLINRKTILELYKKVNELTSKIRKLKYILDKRKLLERYKELLKETEKKFDGITPSGLSMDFQDMYKLLREHNIPLVLNQRDIENATSFKSESRFKKTEYYKSITAETPGMEKMKPYVLVHKTDYYPSEERIKTTEEASGPDSYKFSLDKIGSLQFKNARQTIHFAVNGEVGSHTGGDWETKKYAILIPFPMMPISQLKCGKSVDTYIKGGLHLPKGTIILCPKEKMEEVKNANPNIEIFGYEGKYVTGYANALVNMLGYNQQSMGAWGWGNEKAEKSYYRDLEESELNVHTTSHEQTIDKLNEVAFAKYNLFESLMKKIIDDGILLTDEEIEQLINKDKLKLLSRKFDVFTADENYFLVQKQLFEKLQAFLNNYNLTLKEEIINLGIEHSKRQLGKATENAFGEEFISRYNYYKQFGNSDEEININLYNDFSNKISNYVVKEILFQIRDYVYEQQNSKKM